jgi:hypothetical protein
MLLVAITGIYGLYRVRRQEEMIRETRELLGKVDVMLLRRTEFFDRIEANQQKILGPIQREEVKWNMR